MAPSRKRKSDEMADPATPEASGTPAPKKMRITQTQKQALIDNLQLEITERARHLRAHYALQCADLKSRIERRVNRIPISMRSMTMKELMEQHNPIPAPAQKQSSKLAAAIKVQQTGPAAARATRKRKSSIVIAADPPQDQDVSNDDAIPTSQTVAAPKSKVKATKRGGSRTARGGGGVLSPRSHNSRTLPRSPIKGDTTKSDCQPAIPSPSKMQPPTTNIVRPLSPLKPHSPLKSAAIATTSAISSSVHNILSTAKSTATRANAKTSTRPVTNQLTRAVSQASNHSVTSNTTATSTGTVVKSGARTVRGRAAGAAAIAKKTAAAAINSGKDKPKSTTTKTTKAGTVKKASTTATKKTAAAASAVAVEPPATGRRILRKRN